MATSHRTNAWIVVGLLAATALVYAQTVGFDFVLTDDTLYVTDNPHVQKGLTAEGVRWAFTTFETSNWHPVTWVSLMLDAQLGGTGSELFSKITFAIRKKDEIGFSAHHRTAADDLDKIFNGMYFSLPPWPVHLPA